jgi:hypothetical protein
VNFLGIWSKKKHFGDTKIKKTKDLKYKKFQRHKNKENKRGSRAEFRILYATKSWVEIGLFVTFCNFFVVFIFLTDDCQESTHRPNVLENSIAGWPDEFVTKNHPKCFFCQNNA